MREELRKFKPRPYYITLMIVIMLAVQSCSGHNKTAMDYLPNTARMMIEKDIENGYQTAAQGETPVSVQSMLASILGMDAPKDHADHADHPAPLPLPARKPTHIIASDQSQNTSRTTQSFDLTLDDQTLSRLKARTASIQPHTTAAEISIGPVAAAENAQMASLQAMAKANSIGSALRHQFSQVKIRFNPLQPFGTVKITLIEQG